MRPSPRAASTAGARARLTDPTVCCRSSRHAWRSARELLAQRLAERQEIRRAPVAIDCDEPPLSRWASPSRDLAVSAAFDRPNRPSLACRGHDRASGGEQARDQWAPLRPRHVAASRTDPSFLVDHDVAHLRRISTATAISIVAAVPTITGSRLRCDCSSQQCLDDVVGGLAVPVARP